MDYYEVNFTGLPLTGQIYSVEARDVEDGRTGMLVQFEGTFYTSYLIVGTEPVRPGETKLMRLIMALHPLVPGDLVDFYTSPSQHVGKGVIVDRKVDDT